MPTKLKIDLKQGVLEVEGSESFVKAIYSDFKVHFIGADAGETLVSPRQRGRRRRKTTASPKPAKEPATDAAAKSAAKADEMPTPSPNESQTAASEAGPAPAKPSYKFLDNLDLAGPVGESSLVEFMDSKFPITNEERNLVFIYYLQYTIKEKPITADHIYTCYKAAKIRVPLNLESSLNTTANQRRWIKTTKTGRLSVTPSGKLYVEKQLPKKLKN